jgi:hypothetical protein
MAKTPQSMSFTEGLPLIERLMKAAFDRPRDPRSDAYKLGVRELLANRVLGAPFRCPYTLGTAEADAFFAGSDEGRMIWRQHEEAGHGDR